MKFVKMFLVAMLSFVLIVPTTSAQEATPDCQCSSGGEATLDQVRTELEANGVNIVDSLTIKEQAIVDQVVNDQMAAHNVALQQYEFSDYTSIDGAAMYKGFKNVELDNHTYDYVAVNYNVFLNKENEEYIALAAWVDLEAAKVLDITVTHIDTDQEISLIFHSTGNNSGFITPFDFEFNGRSFACSLTGLFACISYCGIWHLVNPVAGVTCDFLCGGAFAFACSGA
ncbi:hypothetical protein PACILC2_19760 [Paenibacillus cisolokensis]|jgi:hypothetical protein|uniref:Uncharacterized protein n=1 Tax=Paenibacillus cisolokensis TaxID=1658519 RepID=A0ABQ4N5D2_9BACL|nr:putative immunity/bacteriocin fusion bifunctional protein [Paenibacillus cisolokensis]GIQ63408.1 hypothetical protein PACILC2_19760 [Paenibacillus cisolokensis]